MRRIELRESSNGASESVVRRLIPIEIPLVAKPMLQEHSSVEIMQDLVNQNGVGPQRGADRINVPFAIDALVQEQKNFQLANGVDVGKDK